LLLLLLFQPLLLACIMCRFVSCCWRRCWWSSSTLHNSAQLCEGLGPGLSTPNNKRHSVLGWGEITQATAVAWWSVAVNAC